MESMNDKDKFETFLKSHSFDETAPESLLIKLKKDAIWNRPWWKSPIKMAFLAAVLIIILAATFVIRKPHSTNEELKILEESLPHKQTIEPSKVIAQKYADEDLTSFQRKILQSEPEFNLSFIDRPVNFIIARNEFDDLI